MRTVLKAAALQMSEDEPSSDVIALHDRCGVYTKLSMVKQILDGIGWTADVDLSAQRLLEPAAGEGVFVIEAARRLLKSLQLHGTELSLENLCPRIRAFELHDGEAAKGRTKLVELLLAAELPPDEAAVVACKWLSTEDFLLASLSEASFTHTAGNPPYSRWSKVPEPLRTSYEGALPKHIAKGDLFLPFLDQGIAALKPRGRLGFLCSNRWQYMAFAEGFRSERLPHVEVLRNEQTEASDVYERAVDIYPSVLIVERRSRPLAAPVVKRSGKTLEEAGFEIRVGPALGCTEAFVLGADCPEEVEPELLAPWVSSSDVRAGEIQISKKQVICLYDPEGRLRDPQQFPLAYRRLLRFRQRLEGRSIVKTQGAPWYRPIDRVYATAWAAPKLLIPELAKIPRIALDSCGAIPAHGVYAIFARTTEADVEKLHQKLSDGRLAEALEGKAPKVKGGYVRCYKRILATIAY